MKIPIIFLVITTCLYSYGMEGIVVEQQKEVRKKVVVQVVEEPQDTPTLNMRSLLSLCNSLKTADYKKSFESCLEITELSESVLAQLLKAENEYVKEGYKDAGDIFLPNLPQAEFRKLIRIIDGFYVLMPDHTKDCFEKICQKALVIEKRDDQHGLPSVEYCIGIGTWFHKMETIAISANKDQKMVHAIFRTALARHANHTGIFLLLRCIEEIMKDRQFKSVTQ